MAKKNLQTQLIETQTQINDMIANGVNTPQQKNALKIKNDKLKKILKQINMKPGMSKKPKATLVKKQK
jgi:regulator of replication initiation timing